MADRIEKKIADLYTWWEKMVEKEEHHLDRSQWGAAMHAHRQASLYGEAIDFLDRNRDKGRDETVLLMSVDKIIHRTE